MKFCTQCQRMWENGNRFCPIDGVLLQQAPASPDPLAGTMIGQFRLIEKIAEGELGAIYKAEDPVRGVVAVQVLPRDRVTSSILLEAFGDAVKLAAKLNHPHVIRIHGMETGSDGSIGVVMELVSGGTLQDYCRDHAVMDPAEACRMVREAAEGVAAAHRLSMLHAALHPGRIMVTRDGLVKVGGFHRSGLREGADPLSVTPGNLPYLAPEQLGIIQDIPPDYRIDVYSLGVILYELLTARLPYDARTIEELSKSVQGPSPHGPAFVNPRVSPLLSRVVTRAISAHPYERQSSMEEFARELASAGQPVREPAQPMPRPLPQPPRPDHSEGSDLFRSEAPGKVKPGIHHEHGIEKGEHELDRWPAKNKDGDEDRSLFSWFRTRPKGRGPSDRGRDRRMLEDSEASRDYRLPPDDDSSERTVLVDDDSRLRPRKRRYTDSIAWPSGKDRDVSSVPDLPRRSLRGNWLYIALIILSVVAFASIVALIISATGDRASQVTDISNTTGVPASEMTTEPPLPAIPEPAQPAAPPPPVSRPNAAPATPSSTSTIEDRFNASLREYRFFPPDAGSAWEILQEWKRSYPSAAPEAQRRFCTALTGYGRAQLQHDLPAVWRLLDQRKKYESEPTCLEDVPTEFEKRIDEKRQGLRDLVERGQFVLPEQENALNAALEIRNIIPDDSEVRDALRKIWQQAIKDAQARSLKHQHEEAKRIYERLRDHFPAPPAGVTSLDPFIDKENHKLDLQGKLRVQSFSVQVRHSHGWIPGFRGESTGTLAGNETDISYTSPLQPKDNFHVLYDVLREPRLKGNGILLSDGKSEWRLDAIDKNGQKFLAELPQRIEELKKLVAEYNRQ